MAATNPSRIVLKGDPIRKERDAGEAITPGHLLELYSNSGSADVKKHSTAAGNATRWFAVENDIAGDGISDAYATGEVVQIASCRPGDEVYAYLAAGENAAIGDFLESNGDGTLRVVDLSSAGIPETSSNAVVAMALEAQDLRASAAVDTRMKVEVV